jgi:hypothetical protein
MPQSQYLPPETAKINSILKAKKRQAEPVASTWRPPCNDASISESPLLHPDKDPFMGSPIWGKDYVRQAKGAEKDIARAERAKRLYFQTNAANPYGTASGTQTLVSSVRTQPSCTVNKPRNRILIVSPFRQ